MRRWFFNFAAAVSLVLFVASIAAWAWSWRTPRVISHRHLERRDALLLFGGRVGVARIEFPQPAEGWLLHAAPPTAPTPKAVTELSGSLARFGFALDTHTTTPPGYAVDLTDSSRIWIERNSTVRIGVLPLWLIVAATLPLPAWHFHALLRRRRWRTAGACLVCGYDLRATPVRCPECGAEAPAPAASSDPPEPPAARRRFSRGAIASLVLCAGAVTGAVLGVHARRMAPPAPIAHFSFDRGVSDDAGRGANAELKYAGVAGGALVLNGRYEHDNQPGGYRAVLRVPSLDFRSFTVMWRFRADPAADERAARWQRWAVLTGGTSHRWLTVAREPSGQLRIGFNNNRITRYVPQVTLEAGKWIDMACSFDLAQRRLLVMVDGRKAAEIALPEDFTLTVIGSKADQTDRAFTFTNYSNGQAFGGRVDELTVFPRALSERELIRLWPAVDR